MLNFSIVWHGLKLVMSIKALIRFCFCLPKPVYPFVFWQSQFSVQISIKQEWLGPDPRLLLDVFLLTVDNGKKPYSLLLNNVPDFGIIVEDWLLNIMWTSQLEYLSEVHVDYCNSVYKILCAMIQTLSHCLNGLVDVYLNFMNLRFF